jgi:small subunit ribosomal protein S7
MNIIADSEKDNLVFADPSLKEIFVIRTDFPNTSGLESAKKTRILSKQGIIEAFICNLMRRSNLTGQKSKTYLAVKEAFEKLRRAKYNPLQILVSAIEATAPVETVINLKIRGKRVQRSVDISSYRKIDIGLKNLAKEIHGLVFKKKLTPAKAIEQELLKASKKDLTSRAYTKKVDIERIAKMTK